MTGETSPPRHVIRRAEIVAALQPPGRCVKSLRGAVVFHPSSGRVFGEGYNRPPAPFGCTGTPRCREICRHICEHAEAMAIDDAWRDLREPEPESELLHVKLGPDGRVTPSGPPSCGACSKRILGVGFISGVWLYEAWESRADGIISKMQVWRRYPVEEFHRLSLAAEGWR